METPVGFEPIGTRYSLKMHQRRVREQLNRLVVNVLTAQVYTHKLGRFPFFLLRPHEASMSSNLSARMPSASPTTGTALMPRGVQSAWADGYTYSSHITLSFSSHSNPTTLAHALVFPGCRRQSYRYRGECRRSVSCLVRATSLAFPAPVPKIL